MQNESGGSIGRSGLSIQHRAFSEVPSGARDPYDLVELNVDQELSNWSRKDKAQYLKPNTLCRNKDGSSRSFKGLRDLRRHIAS
jgi:hypothetical protein